MTEIEAVIGLILGGITLVVVFVVGVRWMLQTWNREDDGENIHY